MLARYKIYRGKMPANVRLPEGIRKDTRKYTRHCLRPPTRIVDDYLADPSPEAWRRFERCYLESLESRFEDDSTPFDDLANLATSNAVYIGCSCPTEKNPDVTHCHTVLALKFMKERYPALDVEFP